MKVFILTAEHFRVPGLVTEAHASRESADASAAALVNVMLADAESEPVATPENWSEHMDTLQDQFGAAHCYTEIAERELVGVGPKVGPHSGPVTEGEWALERNPEGSCNGFSIIDDLGYVIAGIGDREDPFELEANANLFFASRDLYRALKSIMTPPPEYAATQAYRDRIKTCRADAHAALDKAEGRT